MTENKKSSLSTILWVLLAASFIGNIYLLVDRSKQADQITLQSSQLTEAEQLNAELEKQYYEAVSDLESLRGTNEELNQLIDDQKLELDEQKKKIAGLIRNGKDLKAARAELGKLKEQVSGYLAEIETLKTENEQLVSANEVLSDEKSQLVLAVDEERRMNDELTTAKATLVSEKQILEKEREVLSAKVNIASVIKTKDIEVNGIKLRDNGKQVTKARAKSVNELEICFTAEENKVTDSGIEQFFIVMIDPNGETMSFENFGSGVMIDQDSGEQIKYTHIKGLQYENEEVRTCFNWAPSITFQPGEYTIELYNKGFLAGNTKFKLK